MKNLLLLIILGFYSTHSHAQSACTALFSDRVRANFVQKTQNASERLFEEFSKNKTISEGIKARDKTSLTEFETSIRETVSTFEMLLKQVEREREDASSYYSKIAPDEYYTTVHSMRDHIIEGQKILNSGRFEYKESVFFAYRSSLLFIFMKTSDLKQMNPDSFTSIPKQKFLDFIENSKTYDEALVYSKLIKDEITENFMMLNTILNDPFTTLYIMRGMPTLETINRSAARGSIFLTFNEKLSNVHGQKNFPPFFTTFHDVVHAFTVSQNKNKIFNDLKIKKASKADYERIYKEMNFFLTKLYQFEASVPAEHKDMFHALYNALTHDFVENLYHHPARLKEIAANYKKFSNFRDVTIERALMIHQEAEGRNLKDKELDDMEKLFDQFFATNMSLIR